MKKLQKNIYLYTTSQGINVGCILGEDGVVLVDLPAHGAEVQTLRAALAELTQVRIRAVVFTSPDRMTSEAVAAVHAPIVVHEAAMAHLRIPVETSLQHDGFSPFDGYEPDILPEMTFTDSCTLTLGGKQPIHVDIVHIGGYAPGACYVSVRDAAVREPGREPAREPSREPVKEASRDAAREPVRDNTPAGVLFTGEHVTIGQPAALAYGDFARWTEALTALKKNKKVMLLVPGRGPTVDAAGMAASLSDTMDFIKSSQSKAKDLVRRNKPRSEVAALVPDILASYALKPGKGNKLPFDATMITQIVRAGLERIYDDLKQEQAISG